ncbi:MAG: hypothetical protein HN348_31885, partial [Proteobacteria bacterium]|nr:hypothetical protein [Pseudomonadota bacterium]
MMHDAILNLPQAMHLLLPELREIELPREVRSNCSDCVMTPPDGTAGPLPSGFFHPEGRCCTYHPTLPNYLAGRIIREGGRSARLVKERMAQGGRVSEQGIRIAKDRDEVYNKKATELFGRELSFRCPYWVGGDYACGIWINREAVCRTWHCRHEQGPRGMAVWKAIRELLFWSQNQLRSHCVRRGNGPPPTATVNEMSAWYKWCANEIDMVEPDELATMRDETLARLLVELFAAIDAHEQPMAARLGPAVRSFSRQDSYIEFNGYSPYDMVRAPVTAFALLSQLDGTKPWDEVLHKVNTELTEPIAEEVVHELYRVGALEERSGEESFKPGMSVSISVNGVV